MDGVLVNSEPFWREAEIETFARVNVPLTEEMCETTAGYRLNEVIRHWHERYPWDTVSLEELEEAIVQGVEERIKHRGTAMASVAEALSLFQTLGLPIGLASSSPLRLIETVVDKLGIRGYFQVIHSAQFEEKGKPDPAVFLTTAYKLGVQPQRCLAFEDSYNGMLAALNAGMRTVAVPEEHNFHHTKFNAAHMKLRSLTEFNEDRYLELCRPDRITE